MAADARSRRVRAHISAVTVAGAATAAVPLLVRWPPDVEVLPTVVLTAAMALSFATPLRLLRLGGVVTVAVSDAIVVALLFTASSAATPALTLVGALVGNALRTRDPVKLAFNGGAHGLAAGAAALVFSLLAPAGVLDPRSMAAIVATVAAYDVVDVVVYGRLFALLEGTSLGDSVRRSAPLQLFSALVNLLTGLFLAFAVTTDVAATFLALAVVAIAATASRGYALALDQRRENERLQEVARALGAAGGGSADLDGFLAAVARLFDAPLVELTVTTTYRQPRTLRWTPRGVTVADRLPAPGCPLGEAIRQARTVEAEVSGGPLAHWLRSHGHQDAVAVPLVFGGAVLGALAVYDRRGREVRRQRDTAVLGSLANDAAIALKNSELFASVERERARLAEESRKLRDIVDAVSDGIALVAADGRVAAWNPAMSELTGLTSSDAVGRPWSVALRLRGDDGEVHGDNPIATTLAGHCPPGPLDVHLVRPDGGSRHARLTLSPVAREGGGTAGVVAVARDVTRERETEDLKTDFIATVSHELRTPLTPLKGFLLTLIDAGGRVSDAERDDFHEAMLRQVERLESLVSDLLVVADLERDAVRLADEVVDVVAAVTEAVAIEQPLSAGGRVALTAPRPVAARGDRRAVVRILRALLSNGLKHTAGPVAVDVGERDGTVTVAVTDSGPGISPRHHDRIFQRFSRLGDHLTRATQGSGLGLSIARSLAERLGGTVTLESLPGYGATFTLHLPAAECPLTDAVSMDVAGHPHASRWS